MALKKLTLFVADKTKQILNFYSQKIEMQDIDTPVFVGDVSIGGNKTKIASTFASKDIDETAAKLIASEGCEVAIVVNTELGEVNFRRKFGCKIDLQRLAQKLCSGTGNSSQASGKITETFLNFTKLLSQK